MASKRDPMREDVIAKAAGKAHADAHPNDKKAANAHGVSRRTSNRWKWDGPPALKGFERYARKTNHPERVVAFGKSLLQKRVTEMPDATLIEMYRNVLLSEVSVEADDRRLDWDDAASWLDCAAASERDAAADELKAAIEREFAVRRLTRADVRRRMVQ